MKLLIITIIINSCIIIVHSEMFNKNTIHEDEGGHYWRDYNGYIPKDALPGGVNFHGEVTYIGQVFYMNQLIPGVIDKNETNIAFEYQSQRIKINKNIKILCSRHPEQFYWLPITNERVWNMTQSKSTFNLVSGGYEVNNNVSTYIGRANRVGNVEKFVERITFDNLAFIVFQIFQKGFLQSLSVFEILIYDPINSISKSQHDECNERTLKINIYL